METVVYFLLWAGVIFLMMRFGCGAHVMGHGHKHGGSSPESTGAASEAHFVAASNTDPVCGMKVDSTKGKSSVFDGRIYYFCSPSCRDKFEANPAAFAKPASAAPQKEEHAHGSYH